MILWGSLGGLVGPFGLMLVALGVHLDSFWEIGGSFLESWEILFEPEIGNADFHENLGFLLFFNDFAVGRGYF